jgi:uncharacterized protein YueI
MSYLDNDSSLDHELDYQFQKDYMKIRKNNGVILSKISEIDHQHQLGIILFMYT